MHPRRQTLAAIGGALLALGMPAATARAAADSTPKEFGAAEAAVREVARQLRVAPSPFASSDLAAARLAAATASALAAHPERSAALVALAYESLLAPGAITAAAPPATLAAITAVTEAAARTIAATSSAQIGAVAEAAAFALAARGTPTGASADTLAAAVAAVTSGAVAVAPAQAAALAQAAARGLTLARAGDALQAARSANPRSTAGQLTEAVRRGLDDPATTAPLSAIATSAQVASLALESGRGGEATASLVAAAVDRGALEGAAEALRRIGADPFASNPLAVAATVATAGEILTITSTVVAATASSVSTQILTRGTPGPLVTQSIAGVATAATTAAAAPDAGGVVLPALDQTQVIVSPSRP